MKAQYIIGILLFAFLLVSCRQPEPYDALPVVEELDALVEGDKVTLSAVLADGYAGVVECGFKYGLSEDDMMVRPSEFREGRFRVVLSGLEFSTEYKYAAYVGNGRNVVYSDIDVFETGPRPDIEPGSLPDMSISESELHVPECGGTYLIEVSGASAYEVAIDEGVSWVSCICDGPKCTVTVSSTVSFEPRSCNVIFARTDDRHECVLKIYQEKKEYELGLSSYESRLNGDGHVVTVSVTGNVDWEVHVPEEAWWVNASVEGDQCSFFIDENASGHQRECEAVFKSLDNELSLIHRIIQDSSTKKSFDVELNHSNNRFSIYVGENKVGYGWEDTWVAYGGEDSGYMSFEVEENTTMDSRSETIRIYTDNGDYLVNLTQHSYLEYIDFACPVVKSVCVSLWDKNGDGELSFEEVLSVTEISKDCFEGYDISSFDELKFFTNAFPLNSIPEYIFEGSLLTSVSLPSGLYGHIGRGMFKDCRNLERVDLGCRAVAAEAFMGCISLKEIDAAINDEKAFMGCTGLERVVQKNNCVPDMAFKDCCNLRTVTFDKVFWASPVSIGKEAFCGCTSLSEINDIPLDIEEICESAFSGCTSLTEIRLQHKVKTIGHRAFNGCTSLKAVYLTSGVPPTIESEAFLGTSEDLKFYVPETLVNVYKSNWPDLADRIIACD